MREIKFRAFEKDSFEEKGRMICAEDFMKDWNLGFLFLNPSTNPCNRLKIMQYTGLKDKNGKEIYEGDIAKVIDRTYTDCSKSKISSIDKLFGVICFEDYSFCLKCVGGDNDGWKRLFVWLDENAEFEVIGNIYENPELLQQQR